MICDYVQNGVFTLVIDDPHASYAMASAIAMTINEAVSIFETELHLAKAMDPKTVRVTVPPAERPEPANFIAFVQSQPLLMPDKQARVTINSRSGTIVIDGQVTISPVTITYHGMTISTKGLLAEEKSKKDEQNKDKQAYQTAEGEDSAINYWS